MTEIAYELIPKSGVLQALSISDSTERRRRQNDPDWPPHLFIGNKVYYRREAIADYVAAQETSCRDASGQLTDPVATGETATAGDPTTGTVMVSRSDQVVGVSS